MGAALGVRPAVSAASGPAAGGRAPGVRPAVLLVAAAAGGVSGPSLALPDAARALHLPVGAAAWLMTVYGLGLVVGTPLLSGTAGRRGPGAMIRAGGGLVLLGGLLVFLADALPLLLIGRAVEAVGAAGLTVAAFRIAGGDPSGRAAGKVALGNAVGGITGLAVGAASAQLLGWKAALVLPLLGLPLIPAALRSAGRKQKAAGVERAAGVEPGNGMSRASGGVRARVSAGGALPVGLFRERVFRRSAVVMLLLATVNFGLVYGAPRRVARLAGWSTVPTAVAVASVALVGALLSWQLVRIAPRVPRGRVRGVLAGASLAAAGLAVFGPWPAVVLLGSGLSALVTSGGQGVLTEAAVRGLSAERRGAAVGLFNLAFPAGIAAGPALAAIADRTVQFIH